MTTKHVKVSILDSKEFTEESVVEIRDVDEQGIPMALMRATAGACVAAGVPTPAQEFQRVAVGTENVARPVGEQPESTTPLNDRAELERIDRLLFEHGADHGGARGLLELIEKQAAVALPAYKLAEAIGPHFHEFLAQTREAYRAVVLADGDSGNSLAVPSGDYQRALERLYGATGRLLHTLGNVLVAEPVDAVKQEAGSAT